MAMHLSVNFLRPERCIKPPYVKPLQTLCELAFCNNISLVLASPSLEFMVRIVVRIIQIKYFHGQLPKTRNTAP